MKSGVYRYPQMDRVIYGSPVVVALAAEVDRLDARSVFVLASGTLNPDFSHHPRTNERVLRDGW